MWWQWRVRVVWIAELIYSILLETCLVTRAIAAQLFSCLLKPYARCHVTAPQGHDRTAAAAAAAAHRKAYSTSLLRTPPTCRRRVKAVTLAARCVMLIVREREQSGSAASGYLSRWCWMYELRNRPNRRGCRFSAAIYLLPKLLAPGTWAASCCCMSTLLPMCRTTAGHLGLTRIDKIDLLLTVYGNKEDGQSHQAEKSVRGCVVSLSKKTVSCEIKNGKTQPGKLGSSVPLPLPPKFGTRGFRSGSVDRCTT